MDTRFFRQRFNIFRPEQWMTRCGCSHGSLPRWDWIMSEPRFDPRAHRLERLGKLRRVAAASLRHVGSAAALAAHLLCDVIDEFAGLDFCGEIGGNPGDQ